MSWIDELFDDYSFIVESLKLSDSEKIGYLLCSSESLPYIPEGISLENRLQKIRKEYHNRYDEHGA